MRFLGFVWGFRRMGVHRSKWQLHAGPYADVCAKRFRGNGIRYKELRFAVIPQNGEPGGAPPRYERFTGEEGVELKPIHNKNTASLCEDEYMTV